MIGDWIRKTLFRKPYSKAYKHNEDGDFEPRKNPTLFKKQALSRSTSEQVSGYQRGLVVMAQYRLNMVVCIDFNKSQRQAHIICCSREEILEQAEKTFIRMYPHSRSWGRFCWQQQNKTDVRLSYSHPSALGKKQHLTITPASILITIVVDESSSCCC